MIVNVHNYEAYLLDWAEGTLSVDQEKALNRFLEAHPELDFRKTIVGDFPKLEGLSSSGFKLNLKKKIVPFGFVNNDNYEEAFIAYSENLLTSQEEREVVEFVANNNCLESDFSLFQKAKLQANEAVVARKNDLLKEYTLIPHFSKGVKWLAAASVFLLLGFAGFQLLTSSENKEYIQRANRIELKQQKEGDDSFILAGKINETGPFHQAGEISNSNSKVEHVTSKENSEKTGKHLEEVPAVMQKLETAQITWIGPQLALADIHVHTLHFNSGEAETEQSFLASALQKITDRIKLKSAEEPNKEQTFLAKSKEVINQSVQYENLNSDTLQRKGWALALGRVSISRVWYED